MWLGSGITATASLLRATQAIHNLAQCISVLLSFRLVRQKWHLNVMGKLDTVTLKVNVAADLQRCDKALPPLGSLAFRTTSAKSD
jgi:hypothetical protein